MRSVSLEILVSIPEQRLGVYRDGVLGESYPISTAAAGVGERAGSYQTPRGLHRIRAKIGTGLTGPVVYRARRPTGECYSAELGGAHPERDWILSRILWLVGEEPGFNRGGRVDSQRRFIYIHGSPDEGFDGQARSHGCVRMHHADVCRLFDAVPVGTRLEVIEAPLPSQLTQRGVVLRSLRWAQAEAALRGIREAVFIQEQSVPEALEWDAWDGMSWHVLAQTGDGVPLGCARLLPDGHLGRMAVLPDHRRQGIGRAMLQRLLRVAGYQGLTDIVLHAQQAATGFYARAGFRATGPVFAEAGIPHVRMTLHLADASDFVA